MPEGRTRTKWKAALMEEFMKLHEGNDISWDFVKSFSQQISKLLQDRNFDKNAKSAMLCCFYDPIVGLRWAAEKVEAWDDVVTRVKGVCIRPDRSLFYCPENVGASRLLSVHQDSMLLLLSVLFLHEGVCKSVVNFIYGLTGHCKIADHNTARQAKHLAKAGLDIRCVSYRNMRNTIAHAAFRVTDSGDVLVKQPTPHPPCSEATSEKPPPVAVKYARDDLILLYNRSRAMLSDLLAATQYWFNYNHGPLRLFDDAFFETPEGNKIRKAANAEMIKQPSVDHWNRVLECAREELQRVAGKRA